MKATYWHFMADAYVSLGLVVGGILIYYFEWYDLDGITAIIIALVVLLSTWSLFKDNAIAILDSVLSGINSEEIKEHFLEVYGVKSTHHSHIWGISKNENDMIAPIILDNLLNSPKIKAKLKEKLIGHSIKNSTLEFETIHENCNKLEK